MKKNLVSIVILCIFLLSFPCSTFAAGYSLDAQAAAAFVEATNASYAQDSLPFSMQCGDKSLSIAYRPTVYTGDIGNYVMTMDYLYQSGQLVITAQGQTLGAELQDLVFFTDSFIYTPEQIHSHWSSDKTWEVTLSHNVWNSLAASGKVTVRVQTAAGMSFVNLFTDEEAGLVPGHMLATVASACLYSMPSSEAYLDAELLPESLPQQTPAEQTPAEQLPEQTVPGEKLQASPHFSTDYTAINTAAQSMFLVEVYDDEDYCIATGSGFVAFDEHHFITNHHVIEDAAYIIIYDDAGANSYTLTDLLAVDEQHDIAILHFEDGKKYTSLSLDAQSTLLRGQPVVVIGSPQGVKNTVSNGIISAFVEDEYGQSIQFTAAISPGSSGGALFNDDGKIIGLVYAKLEQSENMNYAIAIEHVIHLESTIFPYTVTTLAEYNGIHRAAPTAAPTATPRPTEKPRTIAEPILQIPASAFGEWKFVGSDKIQFRIQLVNTSSSATIKSYTLYFGTHNPLNFTSPADEAMYMTKADCNQVFAPGSKKYSGFFTVPLEGGTKVYVGIKEIVYSTGEKVTYDLEDIRFIYWSVR